MDTDADTGAQDPTATQEDTVSLEKTLLADRDEGGPLMALAHMPAITTPGPVTWCWVWKKAKYAPGPTGPARPLRAGILWYGSGEGAPPACGYLAARWFEEEEAGWEELRRQSFDPMNTPAGEEPRTPEHWFRAQRLRANGVTWGMLPVQQGVSTAALEALVTDLNKKRLLAEEGILPWTEADPPLDPAGE